MRLHRQDRFSIARDYNAPARAVSGLRQNMLLLENSCEISWRLFYSDVSPNCGSGVWLEVRCITPDGWQTRSTQYAVRSTQYAVRITQYAVRCTQYAVRCTQYAVRSTLYAVRSTLSQFKLTAREEKPTQRIFVSG